MIIKQLSTLLMLSGLILCATVKKEEYDCSGPNEIDSCESSTVQCHRICKYKDYDGICNFDCQPACICRLGFYRFGDDDTSKCVTKENCPQEKKQVTKPATKPVIKPVAKKKP